MNLIKHTTNRSYIESQLYILCIVAILFSGCKKQVYSDYNGQSVADFNQVFEGFWNNVNTNYVYWDIDTTNWDNKYYQFKPLFAKLDLNNPNDVNKSIGYFKQMTSSLIDSHFQIIGDAPLFAGVNIYPAADRKRISASFHYQYDYSKTDLKYFDQTQIGVDTPLHVTLALIKKKIVYFSCTQFSLLNSYQSSNSNSVHIVLDSLFKRVYSDTSKTTGLIIDIRNNFGGNLSDLNFFIGHLINKQLDFGYSRYKSNSNRLDYTPWIKASITPFGGAKPVAYPIVVLVDNYTVSVAEAVAMAMHLLPNCKIVGETTWGATGPVAAEDIFNGGQFNLPNIFTVYTSSSEFKYIDGKMYEGMGFPPDISVPFNLQTLSRGVDSQLEMAISLIK